MKAFQKKYENATGKELEGEVPADLLTASGSGLDPHISPASAKVQIQMCIRDRVFSAEEIYERVWNEKAVNTETIMVHIRNIREKIEINPKEPKYVKVVWGIGYKMEKQM